MKIDDIILAHAKYKVSLRKFIEEGSDLQVPEGDLLFWLEEKKDSLSHLPSFRGLEREHEAFCNYVSALLSLVADGKRSQAQDLISNEMFVLLSQEVVSSIAQLGRESK